VDFLCRELFARVLVTFCGVPRANTLSSVGFIWPLLRFSENGLPKRWSRRKNLFTTLAYPSRAFPFPPSRDT
jgi:hypothetical protein